MYICICHAVTERAIHEAVDRGISTFRELSFNTGCGTQCGSCAKTARQVFHQAISERGEGIPEVVQTSAAAA